MKGRRVQVNKNYGIWFELLALSFGVALSLSGLAPLP
jgi:hypothetical protein